jgi:LCP family protein required for cell wall assembly
VTLTNSQIDDLNEIGKYPPNAMKITQLHSYAGVDVGYQYSMMKAEEILGIEIDYFAEIKLEAFREIVDAVDGIYMDIPDGGLYYTDPYQNLKISVPEGRQLLDGEMAEGVVRFRGTYQRGDMERIDVQKTFMKEFFTQVINKETIMNNLMGFVGTMVKHVRTDFGPSDVPQYLTSLDGLGGENIRFHTLPGVPEYIGEVSYYICDTAETDKLIADTFLNYDTQTQTAEEDTTALRVQLLNGSNQTTISSGIREMLEADDYAVTDAGDFVGAKTTKTRILAKRPQDGDALVDYFANAEVVLGEEIPEGFDVVVILGKSEY